jgi:methylmalonyl-CoA mutase N-terminal domain/subunit
MVAAIDAGFPQREIAESAYRDQGAVDAGHRVIVGVNLAEGGTGGVSTLYIDEAAEARQIARLREVRRRRQSGAVDRALQKLAEAAEGRLNTMPALLDAVRAEATVGEICDELRRVWGEYEEVPII